MIGAAPKRSNETAKRIARHGLWHSGIRKRHWRRNLARSGKSVLLKHSLAWERYKNTHLNSK
jgi:hypothetical protein